MLTSDWLRSPLLELSRFCSPPSPTLVTCLQLRSWTLTILTLAPGPWVRGPGLDTGTETMEMGAAEQGLETRDWGAASAFPLSDQGSVVAAAVVLLLTVSTLPLHIGPQQFSNTLVMMILTHCLWDIL